MRSSIFILSVVVALAAAGTALGGTPTVFTDGTGEVAGGPDIGSVSVSTDDAGVMTVNAEIAGMPEFFTPGQVIFLLNTDGNSTTGEFAGADLVLAIDWEDPLRPIKLRWNGTEYEETSFGKSSLVTVAVDAAGFMIHRDDLGGIDRLELGVVAGRGDPAEGLIDWAPDNGLWPYVLTEPTVETLSLRFAPVKPRAGKAFAVTGGVFGLSDDSEAKPQGLRCRATLAGKELRPAGRCRWVIPKGARGKRLVVTVEARHKGRWTEFRPWTFKVG
jgi:hypothetical protein